jgi:hypothetical protein
MFSNWSPLLFFALLAIAALLVLTACSTGGYVVQPCKCDGGTRAPLYLVPPHADFVVHGALLPAQAAFTPIHAGHFAVLPVHGVPDAVEVVVDYTDLLTLRGLLRKRCELSTGSEAFIKTLREEFIALRRELDRQSDAFAPLELEIMTERLALLVPAPLRDTLFFAYNFGKDDQSRATIDLRPGMRLRIDAATFQPPRVGSVEAPAVGYVATGQLTYTVGRGSIDQRLGTCDPQFDRTNTLLFVDPFLRHIRALGVAMASPPEGEMIYAAGAADLDSVGNKYLRLVYPTEFLPGTVAGGSSNNDSREYPMLLGDHSWGSLEAFAPSNGVAPVDGQTVATHIVMRGRELFVPEILVTLNDQPSFLPIGTTLGDVLATVSSMTPAEIARRVVVRRAVGDGHQRIRFATTSAEILELPMLKGDQVQW